MCSGQGQTLQRGIAGLVKLCEEMTGTGASGRHVQCWDDALTFAKKHQDIYLEAYTTHYMGHVAKQYGYAYQLHCCFIKNKCPNNG